MTHNNYEYMIAEDKASRLLLYALLSIMFFFLTLVWTIWWSSDARINRLKSNNAYATVKGYSERISTSGEYTEIIEITNTENSFLQHHANTVKAHVYSSHLKIK